MHPKFNQPTYRGLFQKAISTYPSAKAVMYANMDILFTSSLARTVDKVRRVYETKKKTKPSLKGWFVVGQRRNVDVPANWSMDGGRWESRMETELMRSGRMFPSYGEDYFIMNPELFNWTEIPPFVVGGIVFDNWLTTQAVRASLEGVSLSVDGTKTLAAIHQNHDQDVFASRHKPKSRFNVHVMEQNGGRDYFRTSDCPCFSFTRDGVGIVCRALLYCDAESSRDAAKFEGLNTMAVQSVCSTVNTVSVTDAVAAACWSAMGERSATDKVVLFGTLKPLKRLGPANESDMYDSFIIAKRTLTNWARLPGVKPVVMADDPLNHQLIEEINAVHAGRPDYSRIDIISEFEMHPKFNQPTYRGLFQKAISTYPSAKAVMYANMDILFTSSLARTVDKVRRVYETKKKTKPSLKGWFVVGRRTNVSVPANWSMDGGRWESRMETELQSAGTLYTATAQDYFIMNPELFNWTEIPPFVVGGVVFDNWLTSLGVVMGEKGEALTVDGTKSLTALHQKHADKTLSSSKPKSFYNVKLMVDMWRGHGPNIHDVLSILHR
ncbi:hypothetical protein LSM04_005917 [Trypanosoma melophagium]|uniref:uncharacterized protein n=1 Tax=Trypanosoma melophagium TaxID=715481 RepID=UPI00351A3473|nr:hypothetical protein LSM04_005917 [Trypanosoma melophagium]